MLASIAGLSEVVNVLLGAGADLQLKDRLGLTAIEWSKRRGFLEVADLLENSANAHVGSTSTTMARQALSESTSQINPEAVVSKTKEPSGLSKQGEDTAEQERIRLDQVARIQALFDQSRLDAERFAEETRRRAEEEVSKRVLRQEQEATGGRSGKKEQESAEVLSRDGSNFPAERVGKDPAEEGAEQPVRQTLPPRGMRIITQDIWPLPPATTAPSAPIPEPAAAPPVKHCPKCNAAMEGGHCPACAGDQLSKTSVPSISVTSFSSPQSNALSRPTIWMLMSVTLAGGIFIGYQLNNYISKNERSSAPAAVPAAAPPASAKPEVTPEPAPASPLVGGALSGAEANIPVPEYPASARSQGISGKITVRVRVNDRGRVILARSSTGDWRLRAAAVQAARKAMFLPEKLDANDRPVSGTITYTFKP